MAIPLDALPEHVQAACDNLRRGLRSVLGGELVALWVHGAATFDDRPARLGDVDTHAVLRAPPTPEEVRAVDELHAATGRRHGVEWDSWYVLEAAARSSAPPAELRRAQLVDGAWALHRAHWLAGQYVLLHGRAPSGLVPAASWAELVDALASEAAFLDRLVREGRTDADHAAFAVWNGCRILHSLRTREVVVSKRAAARSALDHLPTAWRDAILAAGRVYDARPEPGDAAILWAAVPSIVAMVRGELASARGPGT